MSVQQWLADPALAAIPLALVTTNAVTTAPGYPAPDPAATAVWGLARTVQTEQPATLLLLDLDSHPDTPEHHRVPALHRARRHGEPARHPRRPSLHPAPGPARRRHPHPAGRRPLAPGDHRRHHAGHHHPGAAPDAAAPLASGQVRVALHASGINFRDALIALGMYPGDAAMIGGEAAGVITEVGPDVSGLQPGQRVMGLFSGGTGPVAIADQRLLTTIPDAWTFAQAATSRSRS